jgi:hypothetical protein
MRIKTRAPWPSLDLRVVTSAKSNTEADVLKLITIRRQGTIAVLGRNLAVRVLMEKTARLESRDTTINDVGHEGTTVENQVAQIAANIHGEIPTSIDSPASQK